MPDSRALNEGQISRMPATLTGVLSNLVAPGLFESGGIRLHELGQASPADRAVVSPPRRP